MRFTWTHIYILTTQSNFSPTTQLMDIWYTELVAAPVKTIEAIYAKFGLPGKRHSSYFVVSCFT